MVTRIVMIALMKCSVMSHALMTCFNVIIHLIVFTRSGSVMERETAVMGVMNCNVLKISVNQVF